MEIMHAFDTGLQVQPAANCLRIQATWYRINGQVERITQQAPGRPENHRRDQQAAQGVKPVQPELPDYKTGYNHAERNQSIRCHVQISATNIKVVVLS